MMRPVLLFALIVVSINFATSTKTTGSSKWQEIDSRFSDITNQVKKVVIYGKLILWMHDHDLAAEISDEIDAQSIEALSIMREAESLISSKSLTSQKTEELFKKLQKIVIHLTNTIEDADLTTSRRKQLRPFITDFASAINKLVKQISQILDGTYNFHELDWLNTETRLLRIKREVESVVELIKSIAWLENGKLSRVVDDLAITSKDLFEQAYALNANRSLTSGKVQEMQKHVNTQLSVLKNSNLDDKKKFSPSARKEINEKIKEASATVLTNFQEILELLDGVFTPPTNWDKVSSLVWQIQHELMALIPEIGIAALKDTKRKEVHEKLTTILEVGILKIVDILESLKQDVQKTELTAEKVEDTVPKILNEMTALKRQTRELIAKLSPKVGRQVKDMWTATYNLIEDFGLDAVELLEGNRQAKDFDDDDDLFWDKSEL